MPEFLTNPLLGMELFHVHREELMRAVRPVKRQWGIRERRNG